MGPLWAHTLEAAINYTNNATAVAKLIGGHMAENKPIRNTPTIISKPTIAQQRERDAELVTGRFTFTECPGGTLNFSYRKYKGEKMTPYSLKDGEIRTIPRGVAKHLATQGSYPVHEYSTDENGKPVIRIGRMKKRYNFESLEFFNDSDIKPNLYTAERI